MFIRQLRIIGQEAAEERTRGLKKTGLRRPPGGFCRRTLVSRRRIRRRQIGTAVLGLDRQVWSETRCDECKCQPTRDQWPACVWGSALGSRLIRPDCFSIKQDDRENRAADEHGSRTRPCHYYGQSCELQQQRREHHRHQARGLHRIHHSGLSAYQRRLHFPNLELMAVNQPGANCRQHNGCARCPERIPHVKRDNRREPSRYSAELEQDPPERTLTSTPGRDIAVGREYHGTRPDSPDHVDDREKKSSRT